VKIQSETEDDNSPKHTSRMKPISRDQILNDEPFVMEMSMEKRLD